MGRAVTRGFRNNNPGNIEHGPRWRGLAAQQTDSRFATFQDMAWGVRAIAVVLRTYQQKYRINTIRGIVNRWAPSPENDVDAYIAHMSRLAGIDPDDRIDVRYYSEVEGIVRAIVRHENGADLPCPADLQRGLRLAGVIGA